MTKNVYISRCDDFYELKFSEGVQNIMKIEFFQEYWLNDKYLWLTGTKHLFELNGQPQFFTY